MYCRKSERNSCKARLITAQEAFGGGGATESMTTHDPFPLLPGSRKCSPVLRTGRLKPQKPMKGAGGGGFLCARDGGEESGGGGGGRRSKGASHLDTVRSAKCFCWLSACLSNRQIQVIFFPQAHAATIVQFSVLTLSSLLFHVDPVVMMMMIQTCTLNQH